MFLLGSSFVLVFRFAMFFIRFDACLSLSFAGKEGWFASLKMCVQLGIVGFTGFQKTLKVLKTIET